MFRDLVDLDEQDALAAAATAPAGSSDVDCWLAKHVSILPRICCNLGPGNDIPAIHSLYCTGLVHTSH